MTFAEQLQIFESSTSVSQVFDATAIFQANSFWYVDCFRICASMTNMLQERTLIYDSIATIATAI